MAFAFLFLDKLLSFGLLHSYKVHLFIAMSPSKNKPQVHYDCNVLPILNESKTLQRTKNREILDSIWVENTQKNFIFLKPAPNFRPDQQFHTKALNNVTLLTCSNFSSKKAMHSLFLWRSTKLFFNISNFLMFFIKVKYFGER